MFQFQVLNLILNTCKVYVSVPSMESNLEDCINHNQHLCGIIREILVQNINSTTSCTPSTMR